MYFSNCFKYEDVTMFDGLRFYFYNVTLLKNIGVFKTNRFIKSIYVNLSDGFIEIEHNDNFYQYNIEVIIGDKEND